MNPENVAALAALVKAPASSPSKTMLLTKPTYEHAKPGRKEKLHYLEAVSRPRSIEVRADPAAHRAEREPHCQNQPSSSCG